MTRLLLLAIGLFMGSVYWADVGNLHELPEGSLVLDSRGQMLRLGLAPDGKYRIRAAIEAISPEAIDSALKYEDRYFYYHPGVNPVSLMRGAFSLLGGRRQGGSTITMQVARLRYKLKTDTIPGKLRQIWYALALEAHYPKSAILSAYFNLAPYGGNVEGIEAASRIYFHKPAAALTALEAAALAIIPQNPLARHPTKAAFHRALARISGDSRPIRIYTTEDLPFNAPHVAMELGRAAGIHQTGLEPDLQAMLERRLLHFVEQGRTSGLVNAAALLVRPKDMQIVALAGSADYHNPHISGQIDGTRARRSPGSTLKPFIYALGLEQGRIAPSTILADLPRSYAGYDPENFDQDFRGPIPAHEALKASRNLPAITLAQQLRQPTLYEFLKEAQVQLKESAEHYGLALVLGGAEVTMRELASLYAMLANRGLWQPLELYKNHISKAPKRMLSPAASWLALDMLSRKEDAPLPIYYKTGTSNGLRDAWTAGLVGQYVLVVWAGNFDNRPNPNLVGATAALPLFRQIAASLDSMRQLEDSLAERPEEVLPVQICPGTGDIYAGQCAAPQASYVIAGITPGRASGIARKILIDRSTGLRACEPGDTDEVWVEFWPSDMQAIFAKAGVYKPGAPEFLPQCKPMPEGSAPRILLPKQVKYQRRLGDDAFQLPLQAAADAGVKKVYWYADKIYLGATAPGQTLLYSAQPGRFTLSAVDELGRATRQQCEIQTVP